MKPSQRARVILGVCTLLVGVFSVFTIYRPRHRTVLPYEQLTMEQAADYMEYESGYILIDASTPEEYENYHIPGARSLPVDEMEHYAPGMLRTTDQLIYVCAATSSESRAGALKLCELGYTNVTEIGESKAWEELAQEE